MRVNPGGVAGSCVAGQPDIGEGDKISRHSLPGLRLIVSYADKDQNHHGGIYRATNWIYEGLFGVGTLGIHCEGKKVHPRSVAAKGVKQSIEAVRQQLDPNAQIQDIRETQIPDAPRQEDEKIAAPAP